jgi:GNAT superfamily N-acetyltransferase
MSRDPRFPPSLPTQEEAHAYLTEYPGSYPEGLKYEGIYRRRGTRNAIVQVFWYGAHSTYVLVWRRHRDATDLRSEQMDWFSFQDDWVRVHELQEIAWSMQGTLNPAHQNPAPELRSRAGDEWFSVAAYVGGKHMGMLEVKSVRPRSLRRRVGKKVVIVEEAFLSPKLRGKGIGFSMYQAAADWAASNGFTFASNSVIGEETTEEAAAVWLRLGAREAKPVSIDGDTYRVFYLPPTAHRNPAPELHLYDFDGTLFRSPHRPGWWGKQDWWANRMSLEPPCVPLEPDASWWIEDTVSKARRSIADPNIYAVLATGRMDSRFRYRVPDLLHQHGLAFDEVHLSDRRGTLAFKVELLMRLLRRYPFVQTVRIWDDRTNHLAGFKVALAPFVTVETYTVDEWPKPVACGPAVLRNPEPPREVPRVEDDPLGHAIARLRDAKIREAEADEQLRQDPRNKKLAAARAERRKELRYWEGIYATQRAEARRKKEAAEAAAKEEVLTQWIRERVAARRPEQWDEPLPAFTPDMPEVQELSERHGWRPQTLVKHLKQTAEALGIPLAKPRWKGQYRQPARGQQGMKLDFSHLETGGRRWMARELAGAARWYMGPKPWEWAVNTDKAGLKDRLWDIFTDWREDLEGGHGLVSFDEKGITISRKDYFREGKQYHRTRMKEYAKVHLAELMARHKMVQKGAKADYLLLTAPEEAEPDHATKGAKFLAALSEGTKAQQAQAAVIRLHLGRTVLPGQPLRFVGDDKSLAGSDAKAYHGPNATKEGTCPTCRAIVSFFRAPGLTVAHVQELMERYAKEEAAKRGR